MAANSTWRSLVKARKKKRIFGHVVPVVVVDFIFAFTLALVVLEVHQGGSANTKKAHFRHLALSFFYD